VAEVRLTIEEYESLLELGRIHARDPVRIVKRKSKRKGKKDPKMARALRKANEMGKKKAGGFKKGWDQSKIMSTAHKLKRKM